MHQTKLNRYLKFLINLSVAIILISGLFLFAFDRLLNTSAIRIIGMGAYLAFAIILYMTYRIKRNSLSIFLMATLGAQGLISMIANAAFGFQAVWFTSGRFWNVVLAYISSFDPDGRKAFLIFVFYTLLLVFSGILALASYILARNTLVEEVEKAKKAGAVY